MAFSSHGMAFRVLIDGAYATIAEVKDINGPNVRSSVAVVRSDVPGSYPCVVPDGKEITETKFDINYSSASTHTFLLNAAMEQLELSFEIAYPVASMDVVRLKGYVTSFEPSSPVNGINSASVTVTHSSELSLIPAGT